MSEINKPSHDVLAIVKNDAIEDGIADAIVDRLGQTERLRVVSRHIINLTISDVLHIYKHEHEVDPTEVREILIAMNAIAMRGDNLLVGLNAQGFANTSDALLHLESVKGKVGRDTEDTIRSNFPFSKPDDFSSHSFWFQAPFFVRNRIHSPHDEVDLSNIETIALEKGISIDDIYPRLGHEDFNI